MTLAFILINLVQLIRLVNIFISVDLKELVNSIEGLIYETVIVNVIIVGLWVIYFLFI